MGLPAVKIPNFRIRSALIAIAVFAVFLYTLIIPV